jgi:hypothetical protein
MDVRVAGFGLALMVLVAGCTSESTQSGAAGQAATTAADVHKEGFESGTATAHQDSDVPEVSREGFEAGVTSTEIPVPTPTATPTPPPGDAAHSSR